jgi:hypothetical protein
MLPHLLRLMIIGLVLLATGCASSSPPAGDETLRLPSSTAAPTTSPRAGLPPEAPAVQGGKYYAVFLAVAPNVQDDGIAAAQVRAKKLGYEGGVGELGCTPGAQEQLELDPGKTYAAFSVLVATKEEAQRVAAAYGEGVVGIAYVTAGCLD